MRVFCVSHGDLLLSGVFSTYKIYGGGRLWNPGETQLMKYYPWVVFKEV
jgi:hypothetical protein